MAAAAFLAARFASSLLALAAIQESPPSEQALASEAAGLGAALPDDLKRGLENRLRVLAVAAHPDDEDGALLLTFALQGAETFALHATRGEGGQNASGPELGPELGGLREAETRAALRVVGATPRFLGFEDFGYAKRADEAFERWGGREEVVRRLTRAIRELRPHRIFTNHGKTEGHGHHQAVSIALHEAIVAAADPSRFPEQLDAGLKPWRADALLVRWFAREPVKEGDPPPPPPEKSLHFDYDLPSGLGARTIAAVAHEALRCHESQGPWSAFDPKKKHEAHYVLAWSSNELADPALLPAHRSPLPPRSSEAPFTVDEFLALLAGPEWSGDDAPSAAAADSWLRALMGVDLFFPDEDPLEPRAAVAPGDTFPSWVLLHGRDDLYRGGECAAAVRRLAVQVAVEGPAELVAVRPLDQLVVDPESQALWRDSFVAAVTLRVRNDAKPAHGAPLSLRLELSRGDAAVKSIGVPIERAVAPAAQASLVPATLPFVRARAGAPASALLRLCFPTGRVPTAPLVLHAPEGFQFVAGADEGADRTTPDLPIALDAGANLGSRVAPRFDLPIRLRAARTPFSLALTFEDGAPVAAAAGEAAWIDAAALPKARVAFVSGADGTVAAALDALGVACEVVAPDTVATLPLERFTTVVLDVRVVGGSEPLRRESPRLRQWVEEGGHLVVLYHKSSEWNPFVKEGLTPAPLPLEVTDQRVCEEEAPVTLLAPDHELLCRPNVITASDFDGWLQERALYVPKGSYDPGYQELLACSDRGEEPLRGALLTWSSPRGGSFTWCSLALHRQLRAGNTGAFRLLANLVGRAAPPRR